jgi:hypothetical protein
MILMKSSLFIPEYKVNGKERLVAASFFLSLAGKKRRAITPSIPPLI